MAETSNRPIVAVFENRGLAESAVDALSHAGFDADQIGIAAPGERLHEPETTTGQVEDTAAQGAAVGAVAGGGIGTLLGAAAVSLIPGIGPVLTGGLLTGIAMGAAAGAAVGVFAGPFIALGLTEDEARFYEKEFKAGRSIVAVKAGDRREFVEQVLREYGGRVQDSAARPEPTVPEDLANQNIMV